MLIVGLTGGICSGKSVVASMFKAKGAYLIDFDDLSRVVVEPDKPAWKDIVDFFGSDVISPDQTLNRQKLGAIVFNDAQMRARLEKFLHPRIGEEYAHRVREIGERDPDAVVVAVVPLLIEVGMHRGMDCVVLVYTSPEVQIQRIIQRDRCTRGEAQKRLDAQMPIDEKPEYADFVINNEGSLRRTRTEVDEVWEKLVELNKKGKGL